MGCDDDEEDEDFQWRSRDPANDAAEFGWAAPRISPDEEKEEDDDEEEEDDDEEEDVEEEEEEL